ncbi:endonuclease/exonuclease/phosphatase family protein [Rubinisphaera margarita]|uniref:endonuclease/exonuclease/phosphatase family protein n=1 Tax=Rubinisphaera margarita TaxID=2909586 RepID=UPI001EE8F68B|nr:endonuclease/exonuclease/phosphatase family protein [Rubinisphaera margarita]MCG6155163.1 endonuclease/exonuclease/phosphatase family protein [Rubinisphaera margarita]
MARKKSQPSWWIAVGILVVGLFSFLGKMQLGPVLPTSDPGNGSASSGGQSGPTSPALPPAKAADRIRMATFNIQVFGESKLSDAKVTEQLVKITKQFDLVAIQEIRAADQTLMDRFLAKVNAGGGDYRYLLGERLGRTISKEQYAYLYRVSVIEPIPGSLYTIDDREDRLHREPLVASFRTRTPNGSEPFSFTLINMHTDPDEAEWEVSQLAEVYKFVKSHNPNEDDIILLGDLNVDSSKLQPLTEIPLLRSVAGNAPTNTRGTKQYDHVVVNHQNTLEFTGQAGVFDMAGFFQISQDAALDISDHQPVWAEFSTIEKYGPERLASPFDESRMVR